MNLRLAIIFGLSAGLVGVGGCEHRSDSTSSQRAFGKQFELDTTQRRRTSLLDRTDDVSAAEGPSASGDDSSATGDSRYGRDSGILTFGATGGGVTTGGWTIDAEPRIASAGGDNATFDARLLDVNTVETSYKEQFDRGEALLQRGQFQQALLCFDEAKQINPRNYAAYVGEAFCYFQTGDLGKAEAAIEFAIKLAPKVMLLYGHRGNIRARRSDYNGAIDDYTRLVKANPEDVGALATRAQLYNQVGNFQATIADYTAALKVKPGDPALLINRGVAHYRQRHMAEAVADATAVLEKQPNLIDGYFLRAVAKYQSQGAAAGRSDFDEAVRLGLDARVADTWRTAFHPEGGAAARP
jgi:tetratricopeptide (TPR) repeat protein